METISVMPLPSKLRDSSVSSNEFEPYGNFEHDFIAKLKIHDENIENEEVEEHEQKEEEEEFSFVFAEPEGSLISAEDAFDNGQIRSVFPVFNQDLLFSEDYHGDATLRPPIKKVFVQQPENSTSSSTSTAVVEGLYCEWSPKTAVKSNSTGFSKFWRLRDRKLRSNSDGKDAFVFLNPPPSPAKEEKSEKAKNVVVKKVKVVKGKTKTSAHDKHYAMYRAKKESEKHKSYLPYRQELFGFFANTHGLSRNIHPY